MKKTQWIELLHNIRSTIVSFSAIILFIALSTGLFTGIRWTVLSIEASIENEYQHGNFHHFELGYPGGFSEDFSKALVDNGLADVVEGYYETFRNTTLSGQRFQLKLASITGSIDVPYCYSGTLPTKPGEAAVNRNWANEHGIKIGDTINLDAGNELTSNSFRITALVGASRYIGKYPDTNGTSPILPSPIDTVVFVNIDSFNQDVFPGFQKLLIKTDILDKFTTTSDKYREKSNALAEELREFSKEHYNGAGIYVESRQMNASLVGISSVIQSFEKMQFSLVSLFVAISILVCYSAVSRLAYDQSVLIGTKKALGFTTGEIIKSFLIYAETAVVAGSLAGLLLARFVIEPITANSVRETYRFSEILYSFNFKDALIIIILQCILITCTAFITSLSVAKKPSLKLLSGEDRLREGKPTLLEKLPLWDKITVFKKTIIKNCINDKIRVFATLIGVTGCTALVVCALSTHNNFNKSFNTNMKKISCYDSILYFSGNIESKKEICSVLDNSNAKYAASHYSLGSMETASGERVITGLYSPEGDDFYTLFHLLDIKSREETRAKNGVWVNIAYKNNFDAEIGDYLIFTDALGIDHKLKIEGFYEYYLMNYQIIIPKELYEKEFEMPYISDTILVNTENSDFKDCIGTLESIEKSLIISDFYTGNKNLFESIAVIIRAVLGIYLVLSFVLAVLLLLNLFTMFISEKKKELITLMINGFSQRKAKEYIYFDTLILTVAGISFGLILGIIMGKFSLDSFKTITSYYINRIDVTACLFGIFYTSLLTFIMCSFALRKVRQFHLSDINT